MSQLSRLIPSSGPGSGTVTSISEGTGITLTPNPITTTGTVALTIPVVIANGGTNATSFTNTDGVVYFDGTRLVDTAVGSSGQVLTSNGVGMAPTFQNASASGIVTIDGDTGSVTGSTVSITSTATSGSSTSFSGAGTAMVFNVSDLSSNTIIGNAAGNGSLTGNHNTGLGITVLSALTSGNFNIAVGAGAGLDLTSGSQNTLLGSLSGGNLLTGASNILVGYGSGTNYASSESSNISIGANGTVSESNVLRIGTNGSGAGQQNKCFIAGIDGVNVGSVARVVTMASDQLGTATITAGANITITPSANTITIAADTTSQVVNYTGVNNAASPYTVLSTDYYISADVTGGVVSILLPNAPTTGRVFIVKDKVGLAATSNITVTTVGGAVTIDGATSFVINTAYESVELIFNGTSYEVW